MKLTAKNARIVLLFVFIVLGVASFYNSKLRFDYDFESFFPDNSTALPFYKNYCTTFGHDNEFVLIAIENDKGIFQKDFLEKANELSKKIKTTPFVENVLSPTGLKKTSLQGFASTQIPLLHYNLPNLYADDSVYIYKSTQYKNNFFSADGKSICLYVKTKDGLSKKKSDTLAATITRITNNLHFNKVHFAGRIFAQAVFLEKLKVQFILFILISLAFVTLLLWFTFKNIKAVLLPLLLISISVVVTFGLMGALNKPIDIMTAMIPTMIFVAGMSDVIHFYTKYIDELNEGNNTTDIFKLIFKEVAGPTFLTLISTVVGFLSLCYSGIKPIRDFGIYTSVGIIIAFILTYTFLPAMLLIWPDKKKEKQVNRHQKLNDSSHKLFFSVIRNGKIISLITCAIMVVSVLGFLKINTNQRLLDDLSDKEPVKQDFIFFENNYGGVRPLEIAIDIKNNKTIWDYKVMAQLNRVDSFVNQLYHPGFMISPISIVKSVNEAYDGSYVLPTDTADYNRDVKFILSNKNRKEFKKIVTLNGQQTHISAKIKDVGSLVINSNNDLLDNFIAKNIDTTTIKCTVTGTANLIDLNSKYIVDNTVQGLLTGILALALLTFILHKSLKMVVVFLIPNVVPLVVIAGFMGFMGISLKASTAIFFSIAFGIATDDTIHFISRFKLELQKNASPLRAFKQTYFETGKPVLITTLILISGFISLILSDFESIRLFGVLTCITLVVALVSEIFLLPVLLMLLFRRKK